MTPAYRISLINTATSISIPVWYYSNTNSIEIVVTVMIVL